MVWSLVSTTASRGADGLGWDNDSCAAVVSRMDYAAISPVLLQQSGHIAKQRSQAREALGCGRGAQREIAYVSSGQAVQSWPLSSPSSSENEQANSRTAQLAATKPHLPTTPSRQA